LATGQDFLNLFAYTGAFTCAVAAGGAKLTTTVDRSATYIKWAKDNLVLNKLSGSQHTFVQSDVTRFLRDASRKNRRFTLAIVDPPSFFRDTNRDVSFDINKDHLELIKKVLQIMTPGGTVFFSTNHQRFEPQLERLRVKDLKELTPKTIPEDFRNRQIHRCWRMSV
jgi:23S rRNA G2069 N7-methylase RlmK/C1962 C5-methylase RlmI